MELNDISGVIVEEAFRLHKNIGPGLLESVYEVVLAERLKARGLTVARQVTVPIKIDGISFNEGFRADLIVENAIIVELKSVQNLEPLFKKQVLTYLRLTGIKLGLLINFGGHLLKGNIERIVDGDVPDLQAGRKFPQIQSANVEGSEST